MSARYISKTRGSLAGRVDRAPTKIERPKGSDKWQYFKGVSPCACQFLPPVHHLSHLPRPDRVRSRSMSRLAEQPISPAINMQSAYQYSVEKPGVSPYSPFPPKSTKGVEETVHDLHFLHHLPFYAPYLFDWLVLFVDAHLNPRASLARFCG